MNQTLDIKYPGQYKVFIKASDGHGNITVKEIDMEVYKAWSNTEIGCYLMSGRNYSRWFMEKFE